jgi:TrmH family RNA methyltransferase|tara:strand:- start:38 stop:835 length:798 start_codon:yes stop_codon:yes gene_type:complete
VIQKQFTDHIKVVLMRTTHPGNVGAVARAMKNMGLTDLSLVNPEFNKVLSEDEAVRRSAGAEDVLSSAKTYSSLDEAVSDCHVLIGASARNRKMPWPLMNPRNCAEEVIHLINQSKASNPDTKIAFLFGREASGLSNEELHRCHYHVNIPSNPDFSSLNLAMAVQVICYELRMALLYSSENQENNISAILSPKDAGWDEPLASVNELEGFLVHLEDTLIKTEFHNPEKPRQLMTRLRRLFQRAHMDQMEVNILRGVLTSIQKGFK